MASNKMTVKVELELGKGKSIEGKVRDHALRTDFPLPWGGDNTTATPLETLAFALGACFLGTGRAIAFQEKLPVHSMSATVEGHVDLSRGMGMETEARAGYEGLKLVVCLDASMNEDEKRAFLAKVASRCPVCDTVGGMTPLSVELGSPMS